MKKLIVILGILLCAPTLFAASEVIYSVVETQNNGLQIVAGVTAHTDGTVANTKLPSTFQKGLALRGFHVYFGTPAPTNDSDFTLEPEAYSYDILGGAGANSIDAAANNHLRPLSGGAAYDAPVYGPLILKISGNSVNGAAFKIVFDFIPQ